MAFASSHFFIAVIWLNGSADSTRAADLVSEWFVVKGRVHFYVIVQKAEEKNMTLFHDTINRKWEGVSAARAFLRTGQNFPIIWLQMPPPKKTGTLYWCIHTLISVYTFCTKSLWAEKGSVPLKTAGLKLQVPVPHGSPCQPVGRGGGPRSLNDVLG